VPGVAAIVFNSITSISKIVIANLESKGLRLHKTLRARSLSSRSVAITLKKKSGQIKATYGEIQRSFKPKIRKVTLRISFFE
jgi:hypothetical protein